MVKKLSRWIPVLLAGLLAAGCLYPEEHLFKSPFGDFTCLVPTAWTVKTDREGDHYTNVTFIGGFDPDFFLGAPTFSVRWHSDYRTHKLPDGTLEMYGGVEDYARQVLRVVYGPERDRDYFLLRPKDDSLFEDLKLVGARAVGKHFVVKSPTKVGDRPIWGTMVNKAGESGVVRQHAYVLVPMDGGFYVLVYPATREGFSRYEKQFIKLVNSFRPITNGPGGAPYNP